MHVPSDQILANLKALYGDSEGQATFRRLRPIMDRYRRVLKGRRVPAQLSARDALLITYPDQLTQPGTTPLRTLADFSQRHLSGLVSGMHILPFYPSSSDGGFSVIDYHAVAPDLGTWGDITVLRDHFHLMFDAVINHASAGSTWFQAFLRDEPRYRGFFITVEGMPDLSGVVRPRSLPLLTRFDTAGGPRQVWTTFSGDQVDLNYRNPDLLLEIIETLLFYARHGADFIRLDAVAYLWKEIGTSCIHLPQTHQIIRLFRAVLDELAPGVNLVTETNVPHADNISYFGDGYNEAQLVYNFALPPLVLHTLHSGSARAMTGWAAHLQPLSERTTFFNFLASHDGIGLNPVRGILAEGEIQTMVERVRQAGGFVSYKRDPAGGESPYELNINYFDALADPEAPTEELQIDRFVAAHAIMLPLVGLPGIYFHSLFGSRGWPEGVALTGMNRAINRQKFDAVEFERELARPDGRRHHIFERLARLLGARASHAAFDPHSTQQVLQLGEAVFALLRGDIGPQAVLCLQNVTSASQRLSVDWRAAFGAAGPELRELITGEVLGPAPREITLQPYQTSWLAAV